jgi:Lipase (class 3)
VIDLAKSSRCAGLIAACYAADNTTAAYLAIDPAALGYKLRDVILADELGFLAVPVGILVEDLATEEIVAVLRGTRVVLNGPNEWEVDVRVILDPCPFAPGARTERGFTETWKTFRLLSKEPFPIVQLVTGHSLGAAWALLLAAWWKASLISFAGPRVGDREFSDYAVQAIPLLVRWVNHRDIVPKVPFDVWPFFEYIHAGPANEIDSGDSVIASPEAWHSLDVYWSLIDPTHAVPLKFTPPPTP